MSLFASFARVLTTCFPISPDMLAWVTTVNPRETFPAAKSEEKRMFSQATNMLEI